MAITEQSIGESIERKMSKSPEKKGPAYRGPDRRADLGPRDVDKGFELAFEAGKNAIFKEGPVQFARELKKRKDPIVNAEIDESINLAGDQLGLELPNFPRESDPLKGAEVDPESAPSKMLEGLMSIQDQIEGAVNDAAAAWERGDVKKAAEVSKGITEKMEKQCGGNLAPEDKKIFKDAKAEFDRAMKDPEKKFAYRLACGSLDMIPVAGGAKMTAEAFAGKTLGGEKLEGWKRYVHGGTGLVTLTLDCTGVGAAGGTAIKAGKEGAFSARMMSKAGGMMEAAGVGSKMTTSMFKGGEFLSSHPTLSGMATESVKTSMSVREENKKGEKSEEEIRKIEKYLSSVENRPGYKLDEVSYEYAKAA